ncbi:MAG TPA: DUF1700 domain-containing protein [Clostridia bacterium]|nr:DUF1700 domain-containing protein [Clostridia bacterium]
MNRNEFVSTLRNGLGNISSASVEEILYDYREHFEIGLEQGKTEDEISQSLGDPKLIARQYRAEYIVHQADKHSSGANVFKAVFAGISLGFFNLIFMLPVYAVVLAILAAFYSISLVLTVSGAACFMAAILSPLLPWIPTLPVSPAVIIFSSISIMSLGLLFTLGTVQFTKWCLKLTAGYIKTNINIVSKKERESESNV